MSPSHLGAVAELGGEHKMALLGDFASEMEGGGRPVIDPFGGDEAEYEATARELRLLVAPLPRPPRPHPPPVTPAPGVSTRLLALLGDPVGHSLSPAFQNAAFAAAGVDGVYLALRCGAGELPGLLRGIARAGGGGNVTLPHKEAAAAAVDRRTEAVERTGACNTFWLREGAVWGDNTDVEGFSAAAEALLGAPPAGARVLLLGAGGAASAALASLTAQGAAQVVVANRSRPRAEALVERFAGGPARLTVAEPDALGGAGIRPRGERHVPRHPPGRPPSAPPPPDLRRSARLWTWSTRRAEPAGRGSCARGASPRSTASRCSSGRAPRPSRAGGAARRRSRP